jgi:D-alanyl-D-alanine carboxypeptidase (penicillin-binding protein 5/6)
MSRELLKHPEVLQWTSIWMDSVRNGAFGLTNTNKLVRHYQGCDGLKTGYTVEARYCLSATGSRNGLRFIAVVMGAPTSPVRNKEISEMLSYGFNTFKAYEVVKKDQVVQRVRVSKGKIEEIDLLAAHDFIVPMKKGTTAEVTAEVVLKGKVVAPIKAGQVLGELVVKSAGAEIGRVPLRAQTDVAKGSFFQVIFQMLKNFFAGLLNLFR